MTFSLLNMLSFYLLPKTFVTINVVFDAIMLYTAFAIGGGEGLIINLTIFCIFQFVLGIGYLRMKWQLTERIIIEEDHAQKDIMTGFFNRRAYEEDTARGGQASPPFNCIGPQEFVTSCLRANGLYPKDIESHFCVSYYQGRVDSILPQAHFAVFPASPKPWEIAPRPYWVPELPKE